MTEKLDEAWRTWVREVNGAIKAALDGIIKACRYANTYWPFLEGKSLRLDFPTVKGWSIEVSWGKAEMRDGMLYFVNRTSPTWRFSSRVCREMRRFGFFEGYRLICKAGAYGLTDHGDDGYVNSVAKALGVLEKHCPERVAALLQALEGFRAEILRHGEEAQRKAEEALRKPEVQMIRRRALEWALGEG